MSIGSERIAGPFIVSRQDGDTLEHWAREHRAGVDEALRQHGALLFRGYAIDGAAAFEAVTHVVCDHLADYVYRSTPRTTIGRHVYTATEYRADATIPMHNENAYQRDWPMKLLFCCVQPAASGGATPLTWSVNVTRRIDAGVKRRFVERGGVMYIRNFGHGVDLSWETTFQTTSKAEVEAFCARTGIQCEWLSATHLRTRQVCQALARHPITHDELWFNQAHLFHLSSLAAGEQEMMRQMFATADLPRHACYGDGTDIEDDALEHIRQAYAAEMVTFTWEKGDVLLVDNMLVAHGRMPFTGKRTVLVAMGDPRSRA
jgi:alpha-ketoglutarate-dependent taurine dioxygenase